jgi:hypothetical protein
MKNNKSRIRAIEKNLLRHKFRRLTEKEFLKMNKDYLIYYGVISYAKYKPEIGSSNSGIL